jgi:hypothetical protein
MCAIFVDEYVFKLRIFKKIDCVSSGSCLLIIIKMVSIIFHVNEMVAEFSVQSFAVYTLGVTEFDSLVLRPDTQIKLLFLQYNT